MTDTAITTCLLHASVGQAPVRADNKTVAEDLLSKRKANCLVGNTSDLNSVKIEPAALHLAAPSCSLLPLTA